MTIGERGTIIDSPADSRPPEYSLVQDTLDACTPENVGELRRIITSLFREHSRAARHDYSHALQVLDLGMTGLPCGSKAELSRKGYFSKDGIRHGRQLGRVVAGATQELVADLLFAGNAQLNTALRSLVAEAEEVLSLDRWRRSRAVPRMDSGGGSLPDVNWCLARGYQLHRKDISSRRAAVWAATVAEWFDDPPSRAAGRLGRPRRDTRLRVCHFPPCDGRYAAFQFSRRAAAGIYNPTSRAGRESGIIPAHGGAHCAPVVYAHARLPQSSAQSGRPHAEGTRRARLARDE